MRNHRHDLAAENLLAGLEGLFAFAVEQQIEVQLHLWLLSSVKRGAERQI
jgi:hypothetical protein